VTRRGSLAAAGLLTALTLAAVAGAAPAGPVRIAGLDTSGYPHLVANVVTARPSAQAPALTENGVAVSALDAVNLGAAKSVVTAIDTSQSMSGAALRNAAAAARAFVDRKAVISFGRRPALLTGFSTSSAEADGVLRALKVDSRSGTALYDAVVAAARTLRSSQLPGRVIVLLTDGRDVSSTASLAEAIAAARRADAAVYPIGIESHDFDPSALQALAHGTNGTYYGAGSTTALQGVYAAIKAELDRTWRLGYETTARPGDRLALRVTVPGVGASTQSFAVPAAFGDPVDTPSGGLLPSIAYSGLGTLVIALLVGGLALAGLLMLMQVQRGSWVKQRLAAHVGEAERRGARRGERLSFLAAVFKATDGAFGRRRQWRSIEKLLVRGDVPLRPAEFFWTSLGCGVGAALLFAAAGAPPLLVFVLMLAAGSLPYAFVTMRVRRRSKVFENQLPDLLTTIAASLKAGHSFKHGLQAVVDEGNPPASIELKRVLTEAGLGRPMDDALAEMADRVGSENFEFAITAVTIQRQVGGSLASLFDMVSETVRNRQQFARKIRSLTAMGRMSAYALVGIPFFIAGMITLTNKPYLDPLFHTRLGHIMLFMGLGMMAVGSLILKKIVSFRG
jgi:tight adherence protein B